MPNQHLMVQSMVQSELAAKVFSKTPPIWLAVLSIQWTNVGQLLGESRFEVMILGACPTNKNAWFLDVSIGTTHSLTNCSNQCSPLWLFKSWNLASDTLSFLLNNLQLLAAEDTFSSQPKIQRGCSQTLPTCKQGALCAPCGVLGETLVAKAGNHKLKI